MMWNKYILGSSDKRSIDQRAINEIGILTEVLIDRAAKGIYEVIKESVSQKERIVIVCGKGNNGADGMALGILLQHYDYRVKIFCLNRDEMRPEARRLLNICLKVGMIVTDDQNVLKEWLADADVIVDGLLGTGFAAPLKADVKAVISLINETNAYVVSIDIPSGLSADSNEYAEYVQADLTVAIDSYPLSYYRYPSRLAFKDIKVVDIGFPETVKAEVENIKAFDEKMIITQKARDKEGHKGTFGKGLLVGGSQMMSGALVLAASAAIHSGIGTLTLFAPSAIQTELALSLPSVMKIIDKSGADFFGPEAPSFLSKIVDDYDLIAIGNGMGRNATAKAMVKSVLLSHAAVILDADAIGCLQDNPELLHRPYPTIILPHLKEMSYLVKHDVEEIKSDPFGILKDFIHNSDQLYVVLKSSFTIVAQKGRMTVYDRPNSALAKGGSGDVLCGIVLALTAKSENIYQSLLNSVHVHNQSGQSNSDPAYFTPEMMISNLDRVYSDLGKLYAK